MFSSCLLTGGILQQVIWFQSNLSGYKPGHRFRYDFASLQQASRISESAELQRKADLVLWPPPCAYMFNVLIIQSVMPQQRHLVCREIKKCSALSRGQNRSVCHQIVLSLGGVVFESTHIETSGLPCLFQCLNMVVA